MKRIATLVVIIMMSLGASAHSVRYFTQSQASRTVRYLNAQNEMMIYCGFDYEIETYVLICDIWMERVNSAYYEVWVFGYDAYTGDEIYMPLDLGCVWLFSGNHIYNAAQYLRFHTTARPPQFAWSIPAYNHFPRTVHRHGYVRTYHYDIHRHGWMPPAPPAGGWGPHHTPPLPPYYMRTPQAPAPRPTNTWTPGVERPTIATPSQHTGTSGRVTTGSTGSTSSSGVRTGNTGSSTTGTSTGTRTGSSTSNGRGGNTTGTTTGNGRGGNATGTRTGSTTTSGTTPTRGNAVGTRTADTTAKSATGTSTGTRTSGTSTGTRTSGKSGGTRTSGNTNKPRTSGTSTSSPRTSGTSTSNPRTGGTSTSNPRNTQTR